MLPSVYARVALNFSLDGGGLSWQNILWFVLTGTFPSTFDIQAAAASIDTEYEGAYRAIMGTDASYNGTDLRINNAGVSGVASTILNAAGTGSSVCDPPEVSVVVRLSTAFPGKSGRGRVFVSGVDNSITTGGHIDPGSISLWNTLANKFKTGLLIQTMSWTPVLYSRTTTSMYDITSCQVDSVLGTQRRRRPRR